MISIIIPTKNNENTIESCISSIHKSTLKTYEIIVVDNNSTDLTKEIAKSLGAEVYNCGNERSEQRNFGKEMSYGDYLLFLDSDMTISPGLLDECERICASGLDLLYIPELITRKGLFGDIRRFERSYYTGTKVDAVRFVRKSHFVTFNTDLTGVEDWDWDRRIEGRRGVTQHVLYHNDNSNLFQYLKKKKYYSKWFKKYNELYPKSQEMNWKYRLITLFWCKKNRKKTLRYLHLYIGFLFIKGLSIL